MQAVTKMMDPNISSTIKLLQFMTVIRLDLQMADSPSKRISAHHQRCIQGQIYNVRKQLTAKQPDGCKVDDSSGALTSLFEMHDWRKLLHKHSDPADFYHLPLFDFVIICCEVTA
jgi:hypothetical protein